jgi:2-polyprenyl-6-methoxyphenol hydroxylase-like FAD-dependent oxidoreductase
MTATNIGTAFIVGSGPTGLATAIALRNHGFEVRIIDKASQPSSHSKALVIWARTLELLDGHLDVQTILDVGMSAEKMQLFAKGVKIGEIGLAETDSRFNGGIFMPQYDLERILADRLTELGVVIERGVELTAFQQMEDASVEVTVRDSNGQESTARAEWLIDCSGAHGLISRQLDIESTGDDLPLRFSIADVVISGADDLMPAPSQGIASNFTHPDGLCVFFPIDDSRYRIVLEDDSIEKGSIPEIDVMAEIVRLRTGLDLVLSDPAWITSFGVRERVLSEYIKGNILIAGDAAHTHSPAGGHGMNTGIQDAINLAWKLALVSRGVAGDPLLKSYSDERSEIGRRVVASSDYLTRAMTIQNPVLQFARNTAMHLALGFDAVQRKALRSLSMIDINYRNFGLRASSSIRRDRDSLHPGDRLPPISLQSADGQATHLDELARPDRFTLFVIESPGTPDFAQACEEMSRTITQMPEALQAVVNMVAVHACEESAASGHECFDTSGEVRTQTGFHGHGAMLVRPDRHVAFFCGALDGAPVLNWFAGL